MFLTRKEKEKMVIDFSRQGMGTREIARELRMSFSSIGAILRKESQQMELAQERVKTTSESTQAYSLFASGKSSLEVAIELGLEADEAIRHQKEFWKLTQLDRLSLLYDELKGNVWPFLDLCRLSMNAGMDAPKVINFLQIANNELPRIERVIENFRFVRDNLELDKQNIRNQIFSLQRILEDYRSAIREETARINRLRQERIQREQVIHQVEQKYLEIKNTVHQVVEDVLENHRQLLGFALLSLIETLRKDPNKLPILYFKHNFRYLPNVSFTGIYLRTIYGLFMVISTILYQCLYMDGCYI